MAMLIFDFPDAAGGRSVRTTYRDPLRVVTATGVEGVRPALQEISDAVAGGLHAAGYLAYEAAPAFEPRMRVRPGNRMPLLWFGLFRGPEPRAGAVPGPAPAPSVSGPFPGTGQAMAWRLDTGRAAYDAAVAAVREAIADGHTYQVNLTARLRAVLEDRPGGPLPVALYDTLRRAQRTGWHALLDLGPEVIVSVSPELFFRTTRGHIQTRPMKGTRARGRWPEEDERRAAELASSEKDRAENLMIVDLLRNDLGRICRTGSIQVRRLFDVERYPTVWQLTSTVEGRLRDGAGLVQVLEALFPCGSVTGAPKISTMDLIARLETSPREVYCGAIGLVRPGGDMTFSVPIRTLWWDRDTGVAEYGTGGGIVWDSTPEAEYDELLAKAAVVRQSLPAFRLLETMRAVDGVIPRLDRHVARMGRSAEYFGFPFSEALVRDALEDACRRTAGAAPRRLRLTLGEDGGITLDDEPLGLAGATGPGAGSSATADPAAPRLAVALAGQAVRTDDRFLYHKTTHRQVYEDRRTSHPDAFDVLLWNESGEATEFTRGNLVVELDGRLLTPPLEAGLLPGCFRAELLDRGVIMEAAVPVVDLGRATRIWFVNSARGWLEVELSG
jgi:para-aminobenzoate synthetase / 4-amino-4-deoxychorismate lyase